MTTVVIAEEVKQTKHERAKASQVDQIIDVIFPQFDSMIKTYTVFNAFFLSLGILEFAFLVFFFTFLAQSAVLATSLALLFLTFFSYFILKLYLKAKQPEQYKEILTRYVNAAKSVVQYRDGMPESFIALSDACTRFAERLHKKENSLYPLPAKLMFLSAYMEKFSAWCHSDDVYNMQEMLLLTAIDENLKLVKCAPTTSAAHASLANAYMTLANLYKSEHTVDKTQLIPDNDLSKRFSEKFHKAAKRAVSEYKIILELNEKDSWASLQLAGIYRDLNMPEAEVEEYEYFFKYNSDHDALCRLGKLYFQLGRNGHGLKIYDRLKQRGDRRADELIKFYGATE